jgi:hypothetical protein
MIKNRVKQQTAFAAIVRINVPLVRVERQNVPVEELEESVQIASRILLGNARIFLALDNDFYQSLPKPPGRITPGNASRPKKN